MFRLRHYVNQHVTQILKTETGFKQHAKTEVTMVGLEVEIKS